MADFDLEEIKTALSEQGVKVEYKRDEIATTVPNSKHYLYKYSINRPGGATYFIVGDCSYTGDTSSKSFSVTKNGNDTTAISENLFEEISKLCIRAQAKAFVQGAITAQAINKFTDAITAATIAERARRNKRHRV